MECGATTPFPLDFLQEEHLDRNSSLVRTLKSGEKRAPTKKNLKDDSPLSKEFIYKFAKNNPRVLKKYKERLGNEYRNTTNEELCVLLEDEIDLTKIAEALVEELKSIPKGTKNADEYHNLMIGILTFIFYPELNQPCKEFPIHAGRKRIDICMKNSAKDGFFEEMHNIKKHYCPYIMFECKNYSSDPKNPELDQLSSRFSTNRGVLGFLLCRSINNTKLFLRRCADTLGDGLGVIIPLEDKDVVQLVEYRSKRQISKINNFFEQIYKKII